jgi:hypothetical protein
MSSWALKAGLAGLAIVAASVYAMAQMGPPNSGMHGPMGQGGQNQEQHMMRGGMHGQGGMQGMHGQGGMQGMHGQNGMRGGMGPHGSMMGHHSGAQPTMAGQDAFGTIQEVVRILEADPSTDWSKVNIAALREHLIDMNEVTLHATATEKAIDNGVEITVTGIGRTRDAIKRMVPAHVHELGEIGWTARTEQVPDGVRLVVTTTDPKQVVKLKALGFMGIMVQGAHHQPHHLMMAKGQFPH